MDHSLNTSYSLLAVFAVAFSGGTDSTVAPSTGVCGGSATLTLRCVLSMMHHGFTESPHADSAGAALRNRMRARWQVPLVVER